VDGANEPAGSNDGPITGRCKHCDWIVVVDSYSAVARAYQDHLRSEHPRAWLRD
jgi:hypothetical protein